MNYRKDERTPKINERECPYIVEQVAPDGRLGSALDDMHAFHANLGIEARSGHGRYDGRCFYIRWCFAEPQHAASFKALFGGEIITPLWKRERGVSREDSLSLSP